MLRYKSPLRYPGGKATIAPFITQLMIRNGLVDGCYAEPYCGGAGVALQLLTDEIVRKIYLNDADKRIWAFWHSIFNDTDRFLKLLSDTPVSVSQWKRQREIMIGKHDSDVVALGFATFYLNRCNRSGILSAGPIGGLRQNGGWRINARFPKRDLTRRIEFLANYSHRIAISNLDALVFLTKLEKRTESTEKLLVYLDPPYYSMGDRLYLNYYTKEDHRSLATHVRASTLKWVLSYDDVSEIRTLYRGMPVRRTTLAYHANDRKMGRELMLFHPGFVIPPM